MSATPPHEPGPDEDDRDEDEVDRGLLQQVQARGVDDRVARLIEVVQEWGEVAKEQAGALQGIAQPAAGFGMAMNDADAAAASRMQTHFDAAGQFLQEGPIAEARRKAVELQRRMTEVTSTMEGLVAELEAADADGELAESDRNIIEPLVKQIKGMAALRPLVSQTLGQKEQKYFDCKAAHEAAMATMPAPPSHDEVRGACWACRTPRSQGQWPADEKTNSKAPSSDGASAEAKTTGRCSRCKLVFYCSRECQSRDWPIHKKQCCSPAKREEKRLKHNRDNTAMKEQCEYMEKCMPPGTASTIAMRDTLTIMNEDEWIFETRRNMRKDQVLAAVTGTNVYSFKVELLGKDWLLRVEDADELHPVLSLWGDDTQWEETRPGLDYRKNGTISAKVDALLQQHRAMTSSASSSNSSAAAAAAAGRS